MTNQEQNIIVVPMVDYAFNKAVENKFYAYPESNNKNITDYLAIYRPRPVSAVTHIAKVESVTTGGDVENIYKAICFGDRSDQPAIVVRFDDIQEIEESVPARGQGVQGWRYTTKSNLNNAKSVEDL